MKTKNLLFKAFMLLACALLISDSFSQNMIVPNQKKALLMKMTADWCGPCGYYKSVTDSIHSTNHDSVVFLNCHVATSNIGDPYSGPIHNNINNGGGIPAYNVCGWKNPAWPPSIVELLDSSSFHIQQPVEANVSFHASITGNQMTIDTRTKFFQAGNAQYYVTVYIYEDSIPSSQYDGNNYNDIIDERVVRTICLDPTMWGNEIANGAVAANTAFDVQFQKTLDPTWNPNHLGVAVVIWKVHANGKYEAINVEDIDYGVSTGVNEVNETKVTVYPNPVNEQIFITVEEVSNYTISLIDASGKLIAKEVMQHTNKHSMNLLNYNLSSGSYHLLISGENFNKEMQIIKQ